MGGGGTRRLTTLGHAHRPVQSEVPLWEGRGLTISPPLGHAHHHPIKPDRQLSEGRGLVIGSLLGHAHLQVQPEVPLWEGRGLASSPPQATLIARSNQKCISERGGDWRLARPQATPTARPNQKGLSGRSGA